jgi:hypothetical protein
MKIAHPIKSFATAFIALVGPMGYTDETVESVPLWVAIVTSVIALLVIGLVVIVGIAYFAN